jgi:Zn-dependent protease
MFRRFHIMQLGDLAITGTPPAVVSSLFLWLALSLLAGFIFELDTAAAFFAGLVATLLHWLSAVLHQLGHAVVARRLGVPMREIRLLHVLAVSLYPRDELELPAEVHVKRALGGPPVSVLLGLTGLLAALLLAEGSVWYLMALFFALENLLLFGLGAFIPLGFTDGSTLLQWWPRRGRG